MHRKPAAVSMHFPLAHTPAINSHSFTVPKRKGKYRGKSKIQVRLFPLIMTEPKL